MKEFIPGLIHKEGLSRKFIIPPISVLSAQSPRWLSRKARWLSLGIESELGRGAHCLVHTVRRKKGYGMGYDKAKGEGPWGGSCTSVFDPVLCELFYRWFCPAGGRILDPFAGGSVRGIVAARLDYEYTGIDLSERQVKANREQAERICGPDKKPRWLVGDSLDVRKLVLRNFDFIFTCPPYMDLEVYTDDSRDLSTMPDVRFQFVYEEIIGRVAKKLRNNRFACFVVSAARDKKTGMLRDLPGMTVAAFEKAGLRYYNEVAFVTPMGSLPARAGRYFETTRKMGRTHQAILVFVKGDPKKATLAVSPEEEDNGKER